MINTDTKIIFDKKTKYQQVTIGETQKFGRCLFLDQVIQSAQSDQEVYHTNLVDNVFEKNPNIKSALILGGGEGATAKKLLNHPSMEKVIMVDIDQELIEVCEQYLPTWSEGAFKNPKLTVHYMDAGKFLDESSDKFDLIVWDLTDQRQDDKADTPSTKLYSEKMFEQIKNHLSDTGILSMEHTPHITTLVKNLLQSWNLISEKKIFIPSFNEEWIFKLYAYRTK